MTATFITLLAWGVVNGQWLLGPPTSGAPGLTMI